MARSDWRIEIHAFGRWTTLMLCTRGFGEGWLAHHKEAPGPRLAQRLVGPTGKVSETVEALTDVSIGMRAGHPTAEQYEAAAEVALERARQIRAHEQAQLEREQQRRRERWS